MLLQLPSARDDDVQDAMPTTPQAVAIAKLAALRRTAKADGRPACVADGLWIGGIGAARNLKALRKVQWA